MVTGVVVPAAHFAVGRDLVPDYDCPGRDRGCGPGELDDVFVGVGCGGGDFDYVAPVGIADVAYVGVAGASGFCGLAEAGCAVFVV